MNKAKQILLSVCIVTAALLHTNTGLATASDAPCQEAGTVGDALPALGDLPTDDFAVTPTGQYVSQVITGTGSYFSEIHNLLTCTGPGAAGMAAYCIEPCKAAPSGSTAYSEIGMHATESSSLAEKAGAAAILMFGYGGQSSINNDIFGLPEPTANMGGSYGTYVIDGAGYTGLLINGTFFRMSAAEAHAVTAAVIHRLNGSDITAITGSLLSTDAEIAAASEYLYSLGSYSRLNTAANGWDSTNNILQTFTQPSRALRIQVQTQSGEWSELPEDYADQGFDWSPYTIQDKITLRVSYTAFRCESRLIKNTPGSGTLGSITYEHEAQTVFPSNPESDGFYDYFSINAGDENTIPLHVSYGKLESAKYETIRLGIIDSAYGGFPPCDGVQFQQTATITFAASDIAQGKILDISITAPEAAGHTPYYGDGDGADGSYVAGRFFAAHGYQDITVASPNTALSACRTSVRIEHATGTLELHKSSSLQEVTSGNACYSLSGAIYGIYTSRTDALQHTNAAATVRTDTKGTATAKGLPLGTYYITELTPPSGYQLDTAIYTAEIRSDTPVRLEVTDSPYADTTHILLYKKGENDIPLAHACFTVKYYDTVSDTDPALANQTPKKIWYFESGDDGYVYLDSRCRTGGDTLYYNADGQAVLPLGTITIQETAAPEGYLTDDAVYTYPVTEQTIKGIEQAQERIFVNQKADTPLYGQIEIYKTGENRTWNHEENTFETSEIPLAGVKFDIIADEAVYSPDEQQTVLYETGAVVETIITDASGHAVSSDTLPPGRYLIRETAPAGYEPAGDIPVSLTADGTVIEQTEGKTVSRKIIETINIHNTLLIPELHTSARDAGTNTNTGSAVEDACIIDTIRYANLTPGEVYTIKGIVMNRADETEAVVNGGKICSDISFTPETADGTVELPFYLDATSLEGKDIVLYETLYQNGNIVAVHADINNTEQTISYPVSPEVPRTGDTGPVIALTTLGVLSLISLISMLRSHHKS